MSIEQRIRELRNSISFSQKDFGRRIGLSLSNVSELEREKTKASARLIREISESFRVSPNWLLTGEGEMFLPSEEEKKAKEKPSLDRIVATKEELEELKEELEELKEELEELKEDLESLEQAKADRAELKCLKAFVYSQHPADQTDHLPDEVREKHNYYYPAIGDVSAGTPRETLPRRPLLLPKEYRFLVRGPHNLYYFARVRGESMSEIIPDGSLIFLRECFIPREGRIYLFRIDNEFTLKEYAYDEEEDRPYLLCRDGSDTQIEVRDCQTCYCVAEYVATIKEGAGE